MIGNNLGMDIAAMYAAAAKPDPARPFITFYDDATGERTELSYLTTDNWVCKTANLAVNGLGLEPGDLAAVALPPHWLTAAVLLGSWRCGLAISHEPSKVAVAFYAEEAADSPPADLDAADHCVISTAPMATGLRTVLARQQAERGEIIDFLAEVRGHGDDFTPVPTIDPDDDALVALPGGQRRSQAQLVDNAKLRAEQLGVKPGERILLAGDQIRPMDWLLVPLAVNGSVVLCRNSGDNDLAARAASEHARVLTV
jgi:uncharacterized protein (TIGR03089 family)